MLSAADARDGHPVCQYFIPDSDRDHGELSIQLYEQYPVLIGIVPVAAALFYAGILVTIISYQKMVGLQKEKERYFVEQQQVHASIQERMAEVDQFYDGIRRMKHEMKNHLTNIKGLLESGDYGSMGQYISRMDESMDAFEFSIKTGNAVTDVIVNDRQKAAEKQGIRFRSEFTYPESERYDAYDIGIIVNNLLQNALEACGKMRQGDRYIFISSRQKRKFFLIEVRNPFEGDHHGCGYEPPNLHKGKGGLSEGRVPCMGSGFPM